MGTSHLLCPVRSYILPCCPLFCSSQQLALSSDGNFVLFQGLPLPLIPCLLFLGLGTLPTQVTHVPFSLLCFGIWDSIVGREASTPQCLRTETANVEGNREHPAVVVRPLDPFCRRSLPPSPCQEKKMFFSSSILCFKFVGHLPCTNCKSNSTLDTLVGVRGVGIRAFLCQLNLYYFFSILYYFHTHKV